MVYYAYCGFGLVYMLSARAAGSEGLYFKVGWVYLNVHLFHFGKYSDSNCGSMNTSLRFRFGNTLNTVDSAFVFHLSVSAFPLHGKAYFLVSAQFCGVGADYLRFPVP